ncbi:MAG: DUF4166 domain-containing protein [Usitatibacteraceae bacterium]
MRYELSMYESAMGESFTRLAPQLQQFHRLRGDHELHGRVEVLAPGSMLAKLLARFLGTPLHANEGPIRFELDAQPSRESWTRHFPSNVMTSHLHLDSSTLVQKLGAARLIFVLSANDGNLHMHLRELKFFGVPCPRWLMPAVVAEETGGEDRLYFHVRADVRHIGLVAGYRGYLSLPRRGQA